MIRNLKALGLALVAVFAMSAVVSSSASAQVGMLTTDSETGVTLTGTETGTELENSFSVSLLGSTTTLTCPGSTYTGHKINTTPHAFVPNKATEITITPHYKQPCKDNKGNLDVTVAMNGCDYQFRDATTTGAVAGTYGVLVDIVCPVGQEIVITGSSCTVKVPAQNGLVGFHLTSTPSEDIDLTGTVELKAVACGLNVTAKQKTDVTIKGHNSAGGETEVTLSHL